MSDLKACPFCGGEAIYHKDDEDYSCHDVVCSDHNCTYILSGKKNKIDAFKAWNTRADGWVSVESYRYIPDGNWLVEVEPKGDDSLNYHIAKHK